MPSWPSIIVQPVPRARWWLEPCRATELRGSENLGVLVPLVLTGPGWKDWTSFSLVGEHCPPGHTERYR